MYYVGIDIGSTASKMVVAFENCSGAKSVDRLIDEYQVEAVVEMTLQACHTYNVEAGKVGRFVREEKNRDAVIQEWGMCISVSRES